MRMVEIVQRFQVGDLVTYFNKECLVEEVSDDGSLMLRPIFGADPYNVSPCELPLPSNNGVKLIAGAS
jgi:mannose/fructose-specific phosphotransferase system component IIA